MANIYELAQQYVGRYVDYDGVYGAQCVDIILAVTAPMGLALYGNGNQIGTIGNVGSVADVLPWREGMELKKGDIISQNVSSHGYGHVVIFGEGTYDNALVIEQNYASSPVIEHRRSLRSEIPLRVVRFRNQDNYNKPDEPDKPDKPKERKLPSHYGDLYQVTADIVSGIVGNGNNTVVDTFYLCNKVTGKVEGDWLRYQRFDGSTAYLPKSAVKLAEVRDTDRRKDLVSINQYNYQNNNIATDTNVPKIISLGDLVSRRVIDWGNYSWGYHFQANLPDEGSIVKGVGANAHGFIADGDGYLVLEVPKGSGSVQGRLMNTPFGHVGKVYYTSDYEDNKINVYIV